MIEIYLPVAMQEAPKDGLTDHVELGVLENNKKLSNSLRMSQVMPTKSRSRYSPRYFLRTPASSTCTDITETIEPTGRASRSSYRLSLMRTCSRTWSESPLAILLPSFVDSPFQSSSPGESPPDLVQYELIEFTFFFFFSIAAVIVGLIGGMGFVCVAQGCRQGREN